MGVCAPLDAEGRRLQWRCRRGMKELDVLLEVYCNVALASAGAQERAVLTRLLELPDPELARYLLAGEVADDPAIAALIERILAAAGAAPPGGGMMGGPPPDTAPGVETSELI